MKKTKEFRLCDTGSVDDIRNSLKIGTFKTSDLYNEIVYEQNNRNRSTVIKLIQSKIKQINLQIAAKNRETD